jgi:isopentenyl-diphosphate Delta-isomerase
MGDVGNNKVIWLSPQGTLLGEVDKLRAHRPPGLLHLAFSVFVFRSDGGVLLQRRSEEKYHFAGLWSNSCCSHPGPGKSVEAEACHRAFEELGISLSLERVGSFRYRANDEQSGLCEHELVHVFAGESDALPRPDLGEIQELEIVRFSFLMGDLLVHGSRYTPWLRTAVDTVAPWWHARYRNGIGSAVSRA